MNVRVLLVDEQEDARATLERRLRRGPCLDLIGAAASLNEVSAVLARGQPDVVLVDLHHSDGGLDLCRNLHSLTQAPVVVLASYMTPDLWRRARAAGAVEYLLKHVDTGRLSTDIARLAERHRASGRPGS